MINDLHINEYSEVSVFIHNGQYFCPQVIEYEYMQSSQHSYFSTVQQGNGILWIYMAVQVRITIVLEGHYRVITIVWGPQTLN